MTSEKIYEDCKMKNTNLSVTLVITRKHLTAFHIADNKVNATGMSEQKNC
jgi:hypothetical protein